ncbi:MAG: response regulator transcription factor [Erysipelothrix sp.]|nr:response regulator transcription factor [Erysipelothrix sp.]
MRLTILEDDETLSYTLKRYYSDKGYTVSTYSLLEDALKSSIQDDFYLIDVSLPDG